MRVFLGILMLASLLGGCASTTGERPGDDERYTKLIPLPNGFRYIAAVDERYPEDGNQAESLRMEWLEEFIEDRELCPQGFVITERRPDRGRTPINGSLDHIYYTGVCR